ncbi:DUF4091 domain-containing protein [Kribbella sandramycini]|uniref:DUF4091 domain-containing protein n=1 Tax=Kribbella sandramycini TaxID=60450 RepID=A0A7Y4NZ07_9ACTN|nr:glycoside hydrolase domain-containing protein [Kribbella sandramycini]MBB6567921.1 hypothetical protein [Kribbella sandramycini]NOL39484.1 DUF4091 domain-containing protein [Kribbella sandramycini]
MRLIKLGTVLTLVAGALVALGTAPATAVPTDLWTESAYTSVFRDSGPSADAGRSLSLDMARNEYESAQIVLRRNEAFTIDAVRPSALTGPGGTIAAEHVTTNFVDYHYLEHNTHDAKTGKMDIYPGVRVGAGLYPDRLTNELSKAVAARSTQSIWVRVYAPASVAGGVYSGTVEVVTSRGTQLVPIRADVRAVTLPAASQGKFTTSLWHLFFGNINWEIHKDEEIKKAYGHERYSPEWWELMRKVAVMFKQYRTNNLEVPVTKLLADAGTLPDGKGGYTFNWSRFDQIVQLFIDAGAVKRIEGFPQASFALKGDPNVRDIEVIKNVGNQPTREWVDWTSADGQQWLTRYLPALRDHLAAKGWLDMFWTHASDEPQHHNVADYKRLAQRMHEIWPGIKLADAVDITGMQSQITDLTDHAIAQEFVYDDEKPLFQQIAASGKEVWLYNSTAPRKNFLNRFIDQPQWYQRMTIWYAYGQGLHGYLHWAMTSWTIDPQANDAMGDRYIVRPDKERNAVEVTPRYESLRDGIEDYELLTLLGQQDLGLARGLADGLVQLSDKFTPDTAYMQRTRVRALDAAAGRTTADPARSAATTASAGDSAAVVDGSPTTSWRPGTGAQWLQVDLGRQVQLDGVKLRWNSPQTGYTLQTSYDGARWTQVYANGRSDGGTDFAGLNAKGRYLRLQTTSGTPDLAELAVAGAALPKVNVAGGRTYRRTPEPNDLPDSGIESTDGVLADAFNDGRSYGYKSPTGTVVLDLDLGSVQTLDSAALHAYEEFPKYRPDSVRISTSVDGTTYTQRGLQFAPRGPSGVWYSFQFAPATARHVRVTFTKAYDSEASSLFIDELEVYAADRQSLAAGRPYLKSEPAVTHPGYPDTGGTESTDGAAAAGCGVGHGYELPTPGSSRTVEVTVDLGTPTAISKLRTSRYDDGKHDYGPSVVRAFAGDDVVTMTARGQTSTANGRWYELPATTTARYVKLQFEKTRTGDFADFLFLDEVEVLNGSGVNVALNKSYRTTFPATPDPAYPDSGGKESTDGVVAGSYEDGLGYGYRLSSAGQTRTVELTLDLGSTQSVSKVRVRGFDNGRHDYSPDNVAVSAGGRALAEAGTPHDQWFELTFPTTTTRYLTVRLTKTRSHDFADYLFVDEVVVT